MGRHPPAPPAWVCAPDHLSRREKRPRREARCLRGRGCFPEYKSALLSPLLKISMVLHAYRDTSTFLVVAKALYLVTHKLFLPVPCTFPGPPPLWREGHTAAIREDGRWALGGADPCRSLRGLPRKLSEAGSTPGRGLCALWFSLPTKRTFHVLAMPWVTCPFVFLDSLALFLLKTPTGDEERNLSPHGS